MLGKATNRSISANAKGQKQMHGFLSFALILALLAWPATPNAAERSGEQPAAPILLAQGGSTGGTIGKQNKAVSGDREQTAPQQNLNTPAAQSKPAENEKKAGCMKIVGTWDWIFGATRRFLPTRRIPNDDRGGGTWTCHADNYVVKFADGSEDRLKMSSDGNSMSGVSSVTGFAIGFTVRRRQ